MIPTEKYLAVGEMGRSVLEKDGMAGGCTFYVAPINSGFVMIFRYRGVQKSKAEAQWENLKEVATKAMLSSP